MTSANIDTNVVVQQSAAAKEGGGLFALPKTVPMNDLVPPVSAEPLPLSFMKSILDADTLAKMDIPQRECLVGSWWRERNLGFLYGERGKGKSWIGLNLACCLAEGRDCGPWSITKARRVLYIDGEMDLYELQERSKALTVTPTKNLYLLSHQHHFDLGGGRLNLTDADAQRALLEVCDEVQIEAVIYDNISCLFFNLRENCADDWGLVLPSLQDLQRRGISPCIVHHSVRGGAHMRGTSRREDAADWVMQVSVPNDEILLEAGFRATLATKFTKYRKGNGPDAGPWEWTFETPAEGAATTVRWGLLSNMEILVKHIEDGLETCSEIAGAMGVRNDVVSKLAHKAAKQKRIKIEGRGNQRRYLPL